MSLLFDTAGAGRDRPNQDRDRESGFSMMEVATAVSLLGILTISTMLTLLPVSRQTRLNREVEAATSAVRDVLEQVHATPFAEIPALYPDGLAIELDTLPAGEVLVGYEDATADPLLMSLTISWQSPEVGAMSRSFVTVKTE